ncbi:huntingtin-interacting protein 1 isoform X2 [Galleria mellonella]|uniref:Huntingtin-interacting protein 1 isoform X2 n=1 Tax=Galleria mellonella TaxID=7137 RepID=A0A6J3C5J1_GALME|nr:huntingtin-interacting protein 1 isoform X2 [Galleria mellonella]XP_031766264.2 huntingtin-interacting protein 1 isoform X2 [Galleria mellonella]XP_031766266.2 huntingtin-interacting protein 1 isoform X2 [Galleria mellonella]XP_031766267.2 huntingtin-interacting protein 1 isoform X2 [Galleria mellonella]XP_031766268.2 huntingtin-interacting protein 1 isoform X2 [Galleria mellonella]XP_031766269.2 huntingtin-interacting protein 1 isoform X2 [Galleria mellonella]
MNPTDKRFYQLTLAIQKAINANEIPVKEKHVRSTIIGTFQEQSAATYWMVALRLPLQDNRIVAWKFCHVTHKLLREGHPACLDDSQRHIGMIENLGKLWVHLREGYGKLVHLYCSLLVCKLKFHARNPRFPGHMQLTADELDAIAENDVNNYFQICVELFDYMDEILSLQAAVFDSLGNARANSMTASGQCRLAALIPCAQDSSHIYDCNVRLLFRLHAALPEDTLVGHRARFRQQFKKLSSFYKHASNLQYYRNLLTLPVLPSEPPNFLLQSDFGTYVAPVVTIPELPPDEVDAVGSLIDTSDTVSQATTPDQLDAFDTRTTPSPQPDPVVERDKLIEHLQNELKRLRLERTQLVQDRNTMLSSMREHCTRLESQLHTTKTELEEEKQKAEILSTQTPEIKQKLVETEEKAKVTDEKFQKLKGAYTQLREEHITLIRQKAEVDKLAASLRAAAAQHESAKQALQQQLNDRIKDVELLQQSSSSSEEIDAYKTEIADLRAQIELSRQKEVELETLRASMEALEIEHKTATAEQLEKITTTANDLRETKEILEVIKREKDERETELNKVKEELAGFREKSGDEYKKVVEEKEAALKQVAELTQQHLQEKEEQILCMNKLHEEIESLQQKCIESEANFGVKVKQLNEELNSNKKSFEDILNERDIEIKESLERLVQMETQLNNIKSQYDDRIKEETMKVDNLQEQIAQLVQNRDTNTALLEDIKTEKNSLQVKLEKATNELYILQESINEKTTLIQNLEMELAETETNNQTAYEELEKRKDEEISMFKEQYKSEIQNKLDEISELRKLLQENTELGNKQKTNSEYLVNTISELETKISDQNNEIEQLSLKLKDANATLDKKNSDFNVKEKEYNYEITMLKDKLQNVVDSKDELINSLKTMISSKDEQVISLNVEVKKLTDDILKLNEELQEAQAELEIGKNELLTLEEEHQNITERNDNNLVLKNKELRSLHDEISKLIQEKSQLITEKQKLIDDFTLEKQVYTNNIMELEDTHKKLQIDCNNIRAEKDVVSNELNAEINRLKIENEQLIINRDKEIESLTEKKEKQEAILKIEITEKDQTIAEINDTLKTLKAELQTLHELKTKEKEDMESIISEKDREKQMLIARLEQSDTKRLNVECELQDLLQHNTVLEADLTAVKMQLEEARRELETQKSKVVQCAGEAALEVTQEALAALERSNPQETNRTAADVAAKALEELSKHTDLKGHEETAARSAILAAHNTAQLSAYVAELCGVSTDMALSDKLHNDCRTMLSTTKQCLESLKSGAAPNAAYAEARRHVQDVAAAAAAADSAAAGLRSVDDELADMGAAIEDAASQIEEMLAASRAGDSGVKLEVNGKILDACTTLMGAVKILVQDARKLQNEIGDPKTRQKMYRKNPQWSEGLISAAKAVVFAAKLLVSSADEAVGAGGSGRVEGVSAAAHEVAGSTAQLVAASRARAPPAAPSLARLAAASRSVAAAAGAVVAAVRAGSALVHEQEALDTSALTLTATRILEMESKVRSLELETALEAERSRLAALRKRHYHLAQMEENGGITNGKE